MCAVTTVTSKTAGLPELPTLKPMDDARVNAAIRGKIVDEQMARIERLPLQMQAKITYIAQFLAEMVWGLSDSLCDTMASARLPEYKAVTRRLRELRRDNDAFMRRSLTESDVANLCKLVMDYERTYGTLLKQLRFALRSHYRDMVGTNAYYIASATEELLIVHQAVAEYLQAATAEASAACRCDISRVLPDPYYYIGTTLQRLGFRRLPTAPLYVAQFVATFNALRANVIG